MFSLFSLFSLFSGFSAFYKLFIESSFYSCTYKKPEKAEKAEMTLRNYFFTYVFILPHHHQSPQLMKSLRILLYMPFQCCLFQFYSNPYHI